MAERCLKLGGYECSSTEPVPDDLICLICMLVSKNPRQLTCCGKIFCTSCLEGLGENQPCPHCREKEWESFPDKKSTRSILALKIKCQNSSKGCRWRGEIRGQNDHMIVCGYELITCENNCQNSNREPTQILRKDLKQHLLQKCPRRLVKCEQCNEEDEYLIINGFHYLWYCPETWIECDGCKMLMKRRGLQDGTHEKVCINALVECKYAEFGCEKVVRKDLQDHEKDVSLHLEMTFKTIRDLKYALEEATALSDIKQRSSFHAMQNIDQNLEKVHDDVSCLQPVVKALHSTILSSKPMPSMASPKHSMSSSLPVKLVFNNTNGLVVATFKMKDFESHKRNKQYFHSQPFYTYPDGYKMKVITQADDSHLYICIKNVPGKNDEYLKWPFGKGKADIEILNQRSDCCHLSRCLYLKECEKYASIRVDKGIPFASVQQQYTCNDTLYFRVTVHEIPSASKPWLICTI